MASWRRLTKVLLYTSSHKIKDLLPLCSQIPSNLQRKNHSEHTSVF